MSDLDDVPFVRRLVETVGVAGVPGGSSHDPKALGRKLVRFMFARRDETRHAAGVRLLESRAKLAG